MEAIRKLGITIQNIRNIISKEIIKAIEPFADIFWEMCLFQKYATKRINSKYKFYWDFRINCLSHEMAVRKFIRNSKRDWKEIFV